MYYVDSGTLTWWPIIQKGSHIDRAVKQEKWAARPIRSSRVHITLCAARPSRDRARASRAPGTCAIAPSIAHRTILACSLIRRGLRARSTLAAHSARPSPSRCTRLASSHVFVRLRAVSTHGACAVRSSETSSTAHTHRLADVWLRARSTLAAHATRASVSHCARLARRTVCIRLLTHAAKRAVTTCAGHANATVHARCPVRVRCIAVTTCGARPIRSSRVRVTLSAASPSRDRTRASRAPSTRAIAPSIAHRTILALTNIRRGLRARSTLAAHSARPS